MLTALLAATGAGPATAPADHDAKMAWWRQARFGMFIHWGLYATYAGRYKGSPSGGAGEWIQNSKKVPAADYAKAAPTFDPTKFDADAWAALAKAAGQRYVVITAKHHEGFAMFDTAVDDFSIARGTPFKRDVTRELSTACHKAGLKFGVYYSQAQDWHHKGGSGVNWDPAHDGDMDQYLDAVAVPQVRELLSNYGPIDVLWWDTAYGMTPARAAKFAPLLALQPAMITNNRLGGDVPGDLNTPEQHIPPTGFPGRDWETCMTINGTWGYKAQDTHFKSSRTLLRDLVDIASKGGNFLLNVGPTAEGIIPEPEADRLRTMGQWLGVNGEAIYGTTAGPFPRGLTYGRATQRPGKLYVHVFDWPTDGQLTVPIANGVAHAALMADAKVAVAVSQSADGVHLTLPTAAPDPVASVVVLDVDGPVKPLPTPVPQDADTGTVTLDAATADLAGPAHLVPTEGYNATLYVDHLGDTGATMSWPVLVRRPGRYVVSVSAMSPTATAVAVDTGSGPVTVPIAASSTKAALGGTVDLDHAGTVPVKLVASPDGTARGLRVMTVTLKPVK